MVSLWVAGLSLLALGIVVLVVVLCGCAPEANQRLYAEREQRESAGTVAVADTPRVEVTRVGVFVDWIAYGGKRGIYLIRDRKTGREFIGISGVGVTETGSHMAGKTPVGDER